MDAIEKRVADQRLIDARQQMAPLRSPLPPYHFPNAEMIWIVTAMDPDVLRARLPPPLRPSASMTAVLGIWQSTGGSPFNDAFGYYVALEVDGIESPDGFPAIFICEQGLSQQALAAFRSYYHPHCREVGGSITRNGDTLRAQITLDGQQYVAINLKGTLPNPGNTGLTTYLCQNARGELTSFPSTWRGATTEGVIESLKLGAFASGPIRAMDFGNPAIVWQIGDLDFTLGTPHVMADSTLERGRSLSLETLLELLGRPAAIVSKTGAVIAANRAGTEMIGDGPLTASNNLEQIALSKALERATRGADATQSGPLSLTSSERTLLVKVFPLDRSGGDDARALALLTDPRVVLASDASVALQLLGLTGAEARLAAVVGGGASLRQAALSLNLSQSTVSSTLKVVYSKLGIRKQSELAKIVANVSMI